MAKSGSVKWGLQVLGLSAAFTAWADVAVHFGDPDQYTDLSLSGAATTNVKNQLLNDIEQHVRKLGKQFLPQGDTLDITVLDIDMAGAYEPWQTPSAINTRFIRDIYPPRFVLHYVWRDQNGALKADRQETLSDLNYLMLPDSRQYLQNDYLRYEKALLDRWFRNTFAPAVPH